MQSNNLGSGLYGDSQIHAYLQLMKYTSLQPSARIKDCANTGKKQAFVSVVKQQLLLHLQEES